MTSLEPILRVEGLGKRYGGLQAVSNVSFALGEERIVGIIGPNGSGKSTMFNLISCVTPPSAGHVFLDGHEITGKRPDQVFRRGLSRTFQNTRLFPRLTVNENMLVAARGRKLDHADARQQLERMELWDLQEVLAGDLSYGDQKLLDLAMGLIGDPGIVLLDEPLAGIHETVVERIREIVLAESSKAIFLIVEHNVAFMMQLCERVIVLNQGAILADGSPAQIRSDESVINAYLGVDQHHDDANAGGSK
jgi:ABC-type branched-subunit amino acid transport system ATPase component